MYGHRDRDRALGPSPSSPSRDPAGRLRQQICQLALQRRLCLLIGGGAGVKAWQCLPVFACECLNGRFDASAVVTLLDELELHNGELFDAGEVQLVAVFVEDQGDVRQVSCPSAGSSINPVREQ